MASPPIPEHLSGEPLLKPRIGPTGFLFRLLVKLSVLLLIIIVSIPLWLLFGVGISVFGIPPITPSRAQIRRYFGLVRSAQPPSPCLSLRSRIWLALKIVNIVALIPFHGCAWLLDELLFKKRLDAIEIKSPLIEISAGRSGSTQIARYLEEDSELIGPALLQFMIPYLWVWKLARSLANSETAREKVRAKIHSMMPAELMERHESDPFRTDTFDGVLFTFHLNHLSFSFGPEIAIEDFAFGQTADHNRKLWDQNFVEIMDRIARKTLAFEGRKRSQDQRRFFVKGHFLCAADALERKYPDAVFLTVIREPAARIQSGINFLRVNPYDPVLGPTPWSWLAETIQKTEIDYSEFERDWFNRSGGATRCVVRFTDFVNDLEGTMRKVYRECLGRDQPPSHIPVKHPPRERHQYSVNRSLEELGIDVDKLNQSQVAYRKWCGVI